MTKNGEVSWKWVAVTLSGVVISVAGVWAGWVTFTLMRIDKTLTVIKQHVTPGDVDQLAKR